jgi:NADH pyrophosphatase NudC (nudix superfamily)
MIVLGACDGDGERYWNLLGGGVEPGETLEDCLVREVMEEGCARVAQSRYIGCQRVDDPDHLARQDPRHPIGRTGETRTSPG